MTGQVGVCQTERWRKALRRGEIIPWDARVSTERKDAKPDTALERQEYARALCARCPVLEACERMLSDKEKLGECVLGVVAGRFSDVTPEGWKSGPKRLPTHPVDGRQTHCRACGKAMWPQGTAPRKVAASSSPQHRGEGLCASCYPQFSRAARSNPH